MNIDEKTAEKIIDACKIACFECEECNCWECVCKDWRNL